jgi:hypothetical protein
MGVANFCNELLFKVPGPIYLRFFLKVPGPIYLGSHMFDINIWDPKYMGPGTFKKNGTLKNLRS